MADGVSQPGGAGTTISIQNDTHADADLDGINDVYSFNDIVLKGLASGDAIDTGCNTADRTIRLRASLQNGDGVGTAATTLKDSNVSVIFDNTKALACSTVGSASRTFEFGEQILGPNGKPSGRNGVKIVAGASMTLRGIMKFFGCTLRSTTGSLNLIPGSQGLGGLIYNCIFFCQTTFAIGQDSTGRFLNIYNLDLVCNAASPSFVISNWGADQAERVTVACASPARFVSTGARLRVKDMVFIGSPTEADVNSTGVQDWDFIEPIWSGNIKQVFGFVAGTYLNEWWRWLPIVIAAESSPAKLQNIPIKVLDKDGADLTGVLYTDSEGLVTYNLVDATLGIFDDVLKARRFSGTAAAWEERGPFTVRVNLDGVVRTDYLGTQYQFNFPRRTQTGGDQFAPIFDVIRLVPVGGVSSSGREENRPSYA